MNARQPMYIDIDEVWNTTCPPNEPDAKRPWDHKDGTFGIRAKPNTGFCEETQCGICKGEE